MTLDPRELVFGRPGYTFINAAFAYTRPGGNRFNDDARGAWYCAFDAETALSEVSFHLTGELAAIDRFENTTDYAELVGDFVGQFHDLRGAEFSDHPVLDPDPVVAYPAGQELARRLRKEEAAIGLVYPSVRYVGG
ncbi:MAG TPA: RES family NAD+ phosphorylase, partial [Bosea sp. (in: a-proteobacteria)]|uniref:RES family NAD+ phosphorylase n=1 Tax=Bosea sp. (in: a-proteobacteria) TaxID=1871050 RepID=UPI002E0EB596|nr:RES family NAD+ phosphorylase [Bosea sp. (in: a-proteobacteria)]